ncbi:diacylglycerol kinase, partial [Streptomyces sp. SID7982]|nr:diacylglycerol kinase [Streptomyces sp. SID7982]
WLRRSAAVRTGPIPLRVEADGRIVADLDRPVHSVTLAPGSDGSVRAEVRAAARDDAPSPGVTHAGVVTVS